MNRYAIFCAVAMLLFLAACSDFFGTKTKLDFLPTPDTTIKAVSYVPIQPVISGFVNITDIIYGFDELIYAVDKGTEEIIAYNESMLELARIKIPGVTDVMQDRSLDLLALGTVDTTINGIEYKLAAIYRLGLKNDNYGIKNAVVKHKVVHPFYNNSLTGVKLSDNDVRFTGIALVDGNYYYVSRTGSNNASGQLGGTDDAMLVFTSRDFYESRMQVALAGGAGLSADFFKSPVGLVGFKQPPQQGTVLSNAFAYISNSLTEPLKVKVMAYSVIEGIPTYALDQSLVVGDTSLADGFLYTPSRFKNPTDISFSGDGTQLYFICDAGKDSVYVFSNTGLEGVNPPARSKSRKRINVSFGGNGNGLLQFNQPSAIAYREKILYVADAGNKRILRFKLTTDFK